MANFWCKLGLHTWQKGLTVPRGRIDLIKFEPAFNLLIRAVPSETEESVHSIRSFFTRSDKICQKCSTPRLNATIWLIKKATKLATFAEEQHRAKKKLLFLSNICSKMAENSKPSDPQS